jgi:Tol biopolymer transport system component
LTHGGGADAQPDVAPDGTVAFWREGDIWSMDQRGNGRHPLEAVPSGIGFDPDGTKMALLRYDSSGRATFDPQPGRQTDLPLLQVVVVDLATGEVATVGPRVASDVNPVSWTPDGSGLLVDRYDAGA